MQITLNEAEIMNALEIYVRSQINIAKNQRISIDLKAGRGDNGYSATLEILPAAVTAEAPVTRTTSPITDSMKDAMEKESKPFALKSKQAEKPEQDEYANEDTAKEDIEDAEEIQETSEAEEPVAKPKSVFSKLSA